eukprot:2484226-Pleurochrysis_carterae.AAC.2
MAAKRGLEGVALFYLPCVPRPSTAAPGRAAAAADATSNGRSDEHSTGKALDRIEGVQSSRASRRFARAACWQVGM